MDLAAGDMLSDNIRLERELGSGAMGTVWVAENLALGSRVAVKVLRTAVQDATLHSRFSQEARGLAQLDSPHVVRVFDFGATADGEPYIVMELLRGEDLGERLERERRLSLADTVTIIEQVCRALSSAHKHGIVHRDIKPANLFLTDVEGSVFVKVLDFGVAKFAGESNLGMTATGTLVGTPYYMSPEQLLDPSSIDHRSDLWGIAVVAYACLAGTVPFHGDTLGALSVSVSTGKYQPLQTVRPDLPPAIDAWLSRALSRDKNARYPSAMELASTFAQAAQGGPLHVPTYAAATAPAIPAPLSPQPHQPVPPTPAPQHAPQHAPVHAMQPAMQASAAATPSRSGGGTVAIAIGALVLVGGGLVAGWMFSRADAPDRDSKRSERRDERDDDRKKDRKKDRDVRSDETGGASDASERERSEREASAASPDPQPASQPRSRPLAPTPPAAASAPAPPAPAAPAFLSSGMTCAKTKAGGCLACCTQPRMIMDADCRCLKPVCQADESPIPNHCMRVH